MSRRSFCPVSHKCRCSTGGVLSPFLFYFVIDWVLEKALSHKTWGIPITIPFRPLTDTDFADDVSTLADNAKDIEDMITSISETAASVGLHINANKTKILVSCSSDIPNVVINSNQIEVVDSFCYLGSIIDEFGGYDQEISARIAKANAAFSLLTKQSWKRWDISLQTKFRVYTAAVRSILLYGSETWPVKK